MCVLPNILLIKKKKKIDLEPLSCWNVLLRDRIAVFAGHPHSSVHPHRPVLTLR